MLLIYLVAVINNRSIIMESGIIMYCVLKINYKYYIFKLWKSRKSRHNFIAGNDLVFLVLPAIIDRLGDSKETVRKESASLIQILMSHVKSPKVYLQFFIMIIF